MADDYNGPNHLTVSGATNLGKRIVTYWAERGLKVFVEIVQEPGFHNIYSIRSNMVNVVPDGR